MALYKALGKIIQDYVYSRKINAEELEKIPKKGPVIIAANHPKWWDPPILYTSISKVVGRKAKFLTSKNVSDFSNCYKASIKQIKKDGSAVTKAIAPLLAVISAILIPSTLKSSGSPIFVSRYKIGGCSKEAIRKAEECLKNGDIVSFYVQGGTRKEEEGVGHLKKGAAYIAYNLHEEEKINVPVYPILIKGVSKSALLRKSKIKIKVGDFLYIKDHLVEGNPKETLKRFTEEIRKNIVSLATPPSYKPLEQRI